MGELKTNCSAHLCSDICDIIGHVILNSITWVGVELIICYQEGGKIRNWGIAIAVFGEIVNLIALSAIS